MTTSDWIPLPCVPPSEGDVAFRSRHKLGESEELLLRGYATAHEDGWARVQLPADFVPHTRHWLGWTFGEDSYVVEYQIEEGNVLAVRLVRPNAW